MIAIVITTNFNKLLLTTYSQLLILSLTDIIRKCLEKNKEYDLLMRDEELVLLKDFVDLMKTFKVFTEYSQGEYYPTLNAMILFRTEIINK